MTTINGTSGDDSLLGTSGDDTINGLAGNDTIDGGPGNDSLFGGIGDDTIDGGDGNDYLDPGPGADTVRGGLGNDIYLVGSLDTIIESPGEGSDEVRAGFSYALLPNFETLTLTEAGAINGTGNSADNLINGNNSDNIILGLDGNDQIDGGAGDDEISGDVGDDALGGGDGNDVLFGGDGDDSLFGYRGVDQLTGGLGNDTFLGTADSLIGDAINDFSRGDTILISDAALEGFSCSLSGSILTYTGGSLTLNNLKFASIAVSAAPEGGVKIAYGGPALILSGGPNATAPEIKPSEPAKVAISAASLMSDHDFTHFFQPHQMRIPHDIFALG